MDMAYVMYDSTGKYIGLHTFPEVAKVVFNPPHTIVKWKDGTETHVRCDNDDFSEEFGFAMACMRRSFGTRKAFKDQFKNALRPVNKVNNKDKDGVEQS